MLCINTVTYSRAIHELETLVANHLANVIGPRANLTLAAKSRHVEGRPFFPFTYYGLLVVTNIQKYVSN